MKVRNSHSRPRSNPGAAKAGGVLVLTLIFCGLIGLILAAYLSMVKYQHRFTYRAQTWNTCIPLCEAGIEEAMAQINHVNTVNNFAINGWEMYGGAYRKERTLNGGTIRMAIDTAYPPTITVNGSLRAPAQTNYLTRSVRVRTKLNQRFPYAVLGKSTIVCNSSGARVDSFDSTDPTKSTLGQYDPSKAQDDATIATTSKSDGAIDIGNLTLYGKAGTGPGGTVSINSGSVGSTTWNDSGHAGEIEPGYFSDDVNMYIPDITLPASYAGLPPLPGIVGVTSYEYLLSSGDYRMTSLNLGSGKQMVVTGKARLYVVGTTRVDGTIVLAPGASLEFYSGGDFEVKGAVNNPGTARDFSVIGLPTCTDMRYNGGAQFVGTIYAPHASVSIDGGAGVTGAIVANTIKLTGGMSLHYDESLKGDPREARFVAASWVELAPLPH